MRWPVVLTLFLSLACVGIEQSSVVAQIFPGLSSACGGCGTCVGCRSLRGRARRICRRCMRRSCACRSVLPAQNPCAPSCVTAAPRLVPRRVVTWNMVPTTTYRREAHCEQVPVTTYRRMVVTVPQTEYRNVVRYQMVPQQTMVPRRNVSTVWTPRRTRRFAPMITPRLPAYSGGCSTCGPMGIPSTNTFPGSTVYSNPSMTAPMIVPPEMTTPPTLTVPGPPLLHENKKVPTPVQEPQFHPTDKGQSQSSYTPLQTVPTRGGQYFEQSASNDGYRTLSSIPQTASRESKFVPAPSAATVQQTLR